MMTKSRLRFFPMFTKVCKLRKSAIKASLSNFSLHLFLWEVVEFGLFSVSVNISGCVDASQKLLNCKDNMYFGLKKLAADIVTNGVSSSDVKCTV